MSRHPKSDPLDCQLRDAFKVIDRDRTGYVVVSDLKRILTNIGEKLEPAEFYELIREVDVGSDGNIKNEVESIDVFFMGVSVAVLDCFVLVVMNYTSITMLRNDLLGLAF